MNLASWLLLAVVVVWMILALVHIIRNRGGCCGSHHGGCDGCCSGCTGCACRKDCGKSNHRG